MLTNTIQTRLRSLFFAAIAILLGTTACDTTGIEDALENFNVVVELPPINTTGGIVLQDAVTKELITSPLTVTFTGEYANDIIDMYSDPLPTTRIDGGVFNFGLDNRVIPSESNPVTVTMTLSANGYVTITHRITFTETGKNGFHVNMMAEADPPTGVTVERSQDGFSENGILSDSITITRFEESGQEASGTSIMIPSGAKLITENGDAASGPLSIKTIQYDAEEADAVMALNPELLEPLEDTTMVMLAALDLEIRDSEGNSIIALEGSSGNNSSSKGYGYNQRDIENYPYVVNFILNETSDPYSLLGLAYLAKNLDQRVVWAFPPEVSQLAGGKVQLEYILESEIFRQIALVYFEKDPVDITASFDRNGNAGDLEVAVFEHGFIRASTLKDGKSTLPFRNITKGQKTLSVALDHVPGGRFFDSFSVSEPGSVNFTLLAPPVTLIDAVVFVFLQCDNPSQKLRVTDIPTATALYRKKGATLGTPWRIATSLNFDYSSGEQAVLGGSAVLNGVEQGERYDFKFTYDNNVEDGTLLVDGQSVDYVHTTSSSACQ